MTTHLVSAESAKEIINKQLQLESENRSMAYLIWHYDQKESDRNVGENILNIQLLLTVRIKRI